MRQSRALLMDAVSQAERQLRRLVSLNTIEMKPNARGTCPNRIDFKPAKLH